MSDEIIPPHQGVYVRLRPSKLHGVGVFAIREIPPGTNLFPHDPGGLRELDPKSWRTRIRRSGNSMTIIACCPTENGTGPATSII
jgi:hypothetical protein